VRPPPRAPGWPTICTPPPLFRLAPITFGGKRIQRGAATSVTALAGSGRSVLGFEPTYSMHRTIAESTGASYRAVTRRGTWYRHRGSRRRGRTPSSPLWCSPAPPTTRPALTPRRHHRAIYDPTAGIVIVDELHTGWPWRCSAAASGPPLGRPRPSHCWGFAGTLPVPQPPQHGRRRAANGDVGRLVATGVNGEQVRAGAHPPRRAVYAHRVHPAR
jgi:hypothetical protein